MKLTVLIFFLLAAGIDLARAQQLKPGKVREPALTLRLRRATMPISTPVPLIASITFLRLADGAPIQAAGTGHGILSLGTLSNTPRPDQNGAKIQPQDGSFVVSTRLGLRIDLSDASRTGTATVSAYLLSADPLRTVWLDGVRLTFTPDVISGRVAYGAVTEHVLKIVVSDSAPPGQLLDLIAVVVTPN